jgi:transcriptional regulator with XRE-family HTH domain
MDARVSVVPTRGESLSRALKTLRRRRGMRPLQVAAAIGIALRTYQYFEAGRGTLDIDRIHRVARVLGADPWALLVAVEIGSPDFAVRCAENRLMTLLIKALKRFDEQVRDGIARLDVRTLSTTFARTFEDLGRDARELDAFLEGWGDDTGLSVPPSPAQD